MNRASVVVVLYAISFTIAALSSLVAAVKDGQVFSQQRRNRISQALTGHVRRMESRLKQAQSTRGMKNHFYGKKHSLKSIELMLRNRPDLSGKNHPMFGKHHSEEANRKNAAKHIGRKHTAEWIILMSKRNSGHNNPFYHQKHKEETRIILKEARKYRIFPVKDTQPEIKVQNRLTDLRVNFDTHVPFKTPLGYHQVDILIEALKLIIEIDGDYWHANPKRYGSDDVIAGTPAKEIWEYDKGITKNLSAQGYTVIRV